MLHGSGPLDRNENTKGQRLDIFNVFADVLCQSRIASFRYDKRGCGRSEGSFKTAGFHDLIEDPSAALDTLRSRTNASRVILLAHSEGTLTAPVLAARKGEVAGLVLLCPTVAPMEATLLAQAAQLSKDIGQMPRLSGAVMRAYFALAGGPLRTQQRLIERVRASTQDMLRRGLSRIPAKWLRELLLASPGVV
jgi:pimeloyl-ACP methyl ester carboxylesterase